MLKEERCIKCVRCGTSFMTTCTTAKYCVDCRIDHKKIYKERFKAKQKEKAEKEKQKASLAKERAEISRKAKKQGTTYGQYVAQMEGFTKMKENDVVMKRKEVQKNDSRKSE